MPIKIPTSEEARRNGALGGKASGEARRRKKTLAEFLKVWADSEPNEKDKQTLNKLFPNNDELSNKALLVLPLLKKANSGDVKAIEMIVKLLGEDRKLEAEIEKLKAENALLKSGAGIGIEPVIIRMDVKEETEDSNGNQC